MKTPLLFLLLIISLSVPAQITTDGTLGPALNLPGPDYQITPDLGQQRGGNLFHSFQDFNLQRLESATFSGPNSVQNILSRVTGGNPSQIDGLIRSTIPNADFYFLNPYGIMFGPNARLDVQGSFHASTADYLRLQDGGRFDARNPNDSLLTVAPIESFGFLTNSPAEITAQDSQLVVPYGRTLSLIGGDLNLNGEISFFGTSNQNMEREFTTQLAAPFGRINLASVASKSEIIPTKLGLDMSAGTIGGNVIIGQSKITTSGIGGGDIFIRAGQFKLLNSDIIGEVLAKQNGGIIDIRADEIRLDGAGNYSYISSNSHGAGHGGQINLLAKKLTLTNGTIVLAIGYGTGDAGSISIKVTDTFQFLGKYLFEKRTSSSILSATQSTGQGGDIEIEAHNLTINGGAQIGSTTFNSGNSGNVRVKVTDTLTIFGKNEAGLMSGIFASTQPLLSAIPKYNTGDAGNIELEAGKINLLYGGIISSNSLGLGNAGVIKVKTHKLTASGTAFSDYWGRYYHSGISSSSIVADEVGGQSGHLIVQADTIHLIDEAQIATSAANAGGGNIEIKTADLIHLQGGQITTSVQNGTGDGGSITIENPVFVVLNNGKIIARADEGHGGNINLISDHLISSQESLIDASSRKGIDGVVFVSAPETDMSGQLLVLSTEMVNAADQMQEPCSSRIAENLSSFVVAPREGIATSPDDLLPSGPHLFKLGPAKTTKSVKLRNTTAKRHPQMAYRSGCQPKSSTENSVMPEQLF